MQDGIMPKGKKQISFSITLDDLVSFYFLCFPYVHFGAYLGYGIPKAT
jgi:hypothetical protein